MKILILTNYFPPEIGAASHLYYDLAESLAGLGHEVTVVTGFPRYRAQSRQRLVRRDTVGRSSVIRIASSPFDKGGAIRRGLDHLYLAPSLAAGGLLASRPDVILAYSPPLTLGASAWALAHRWNVPFVVNVQDLFPQYAVDIGVLTNRSMIRAFEWLERFVYRTADAVIVNSPASRGHVISRGGSANRVVAISNWVDVDIVCAGPRQNRFRVQSGIGDVFLAQYAGTMGYQQDLGTLIEAAALLKGDRGVRFQLVGDGVERERLEARVEELKLQNVSFAPFQPEEDYPLVAQSADVGLVMLRPEVKTPAIPSKLVSIMASGRPVIVSADPGGDAPALVREVDCGIVVPPGCPEALAAAVLRLRDDPNTARSMGRRARAFAVASFSRRERVQDYAAVMERAILARSPGR